MPADTHVLIRDVRPLGGGSIDILIRDGRIVALGANLSAPDATVIEGGGRLVFPGFVDAHAHIDKTLFGLGWYRNEVGPTLLDKIENERALRRERGIDSHVQSGRIARRMIAAGTTHVRTFVDIDTDIGLSGFEGVLRTREDLKGALDIQIVAFPQSGMLVRSGTVELMDEALRSGAEVVGGHALCLGGVDPGYLDRLIDLLLEADIAVMSHGPSGLRPVPEVMRLRRAGVRMCTGNDGIRDAWGPLNMPDMLLRTYLIAYRNNLRRDDEIQAVLDIATHGGAQVIGAQPYGLSPGSPADLVLVPGETHVEAVIEQPKDRIALKDGKVVAKGGECVVG
jgi:cytosine deaminase